MGEALAYGKRPLSSPTAIDRKFDSQKWQLLRATPRMSIRDKQRLAYTEFQIGRLKMSRAHEKKADRDYQGAFGLYNEAVERFDKALSLGPATQLKKSILQARMEAESAVLECERLLQEQTKLPPSSKPS